MEHGSPSISDDSLAKSSLDSKALQAEKENPSANNVGAETGSRGVNDAPGSVSLPEDDRCMPVTNLVRIMRKVLPPQAKVAEQAKETMQVCVSEFIGFITSEANERCQKEHRRIVTAEDILWAMDTLGFDNYVGPLVSFLKRYRQSEVPNLGGRGRVPLPQVVGTYPIISSSSSSPSPSPSPSLLSPQYMMACYGPNFPPSQNWCQGMFDSSGMCEFYDDASGGSGNVVSDFDPLNIHKRA